MWFFKPDIEKLKANGDIGELCHLLKSRKSDVRTEAEQALLGMGEDAFSSLIQALDRPNHEEYLDDLVELHCEKGNRRAFDMLFSVLDTDNENARGVLASSVFAHGGDGAVGMAVRGLADSGVGNPEGAISVLAADRGVKAVEALLRACADPRVDSLVWEKLMQIAAVDVAPFASALESPDPDILDLAFALVMDHGTPDASVAAGLANILVLNDSFLEDSRILETFAPLGNQHQRRQSAKPDAETVAKQRAFAEGLLAKVKVAPEASAMGLRFAYEATIRTYGIERPEIHAFVEAIPSEWLAPSTDCIRCWQSTDDDTVPFAFVPVYGDNVIARLCRNCARHVRRKLGEGEASPERLAIYPALWQPEEFAAFLNSLPVIDDDGTMELGRSFQMQDANWRSISSKACRPVDTQAAVEAMMEFWGEGVDPSKTEHCAIFLDEGKVSIGAMGSTLSMIRVGDDQWKGAYTQKTQREKILGR